MSQPSKTDPLLALLTELDEDVHRITGKAEGMGELRTAITGTRLRARIGRLQARLSRAHGGENEEGDNVPRTIINFPKPSPEQLKAMENPVTIDPPRASRRRTLR